MKSGPALEARGLKRTFGPVVAVDDVSFSVQRGELLAIFGPNGAGKTSLLGLLSGELTPEQGDILLEGEKRDQGDREWRRRFGLLSHESFFYGALTAEENLTFYGRLFGVGDLRGAVHERLEGVGLAKRARTPVGQFSRGMRQRLALARALLHQPDFVLLDEPFTGLDPHGAEVLRGVLSALRDGARTLVMVTHDLKQGMGLADRVAIQVGGGFRWEGRTSDVDQAGIERFYHSVVEGVT